MLLHLAGPDAQEIFTTLTETGDTTNYASAVQALNAYFVPQVNSAFTRQTFHRMVVSKTNTEARSTQNSKTKTPKSRKRSTQKLDTGLSFINTRPMLIQQESSTITNRILLFPTIEPSPRLLS